MNIKFKYIFAFIIILSTAVFSGCIKIELKGEIDQNYLAVYQGSIELNLGKYEYSQQALAQESLLKLSTYWKSIGYESQVSIENDTYYVYFIKQIQCSSYEEAFEELFNLMSDDYSPFSDLSYSYTSYSSYSEYEYSGSLDISDFYDIDVYSDMQDSIKTTIDDELNNLDASVVFVLPNQDNASQPPSFTKTFTTELKYNETNEFNIKGKVISSDVASNNTAAGLQYSNYRILPYIFTVILSILVILTLIIIHKLRKSK